MITRLPGLASRAGLMVVPVGISLACMPLGVGIGAGASVGGNAGVDCPVRAVKTGAGAMTPLRPELLLIVLLLSELLTVPLAVLLSVLVSGDVPLIVRSSRKIVSFFGGAGAVSRCVGICGVSRSESRSSDSEFKAPGKSEPGDKSSGRAVSCTTDSRTTGSRAIVSRNGVSTAGRVSAFE